MAQQLINIQVVYALPNQQRVYTVQLPAGATLRHAIEASQILRDYPEINLSGQSVGIYGEKAELDSVLHNHDRVEIYRPLTIDPKEARRLRAARKQANS